MATELISMICISNQIKGEIQRDFKLRSLKVKLNHLNSQLEPLFKLRMGKITC